MSKLIKLTQEAIELLRAEFDKELANAKLSDGKLSFTRSFSDTKRKATLYFQEIAYIKMLALVRDFNNEVAWHGVATRGDDPEKDEYIISDIVVYPQEVTGATVNTDQEKYTDWLYSLDDEVFNNLRMQGHSHVNMAVSPSTVDTTLYDQILEQVEDDMFYIFLIWNKRGEKTIKIYDLAKNVLFETGDVTVKVLEDEMGVEKFLADARGMVKTKTYQNTKTTTKPKETPTKVETKGTTKPVSSADYDYYDDFEYGAWGYGNYYSQYSMYKEKYNK